MMKALALLLLIGKLSHVTSTSLLSQLDRRGNNVCLHCQPSSAWNPYQKGANHSSSSSQLGRCCRNLAALALEEAKEDEFDLVEEYKYEEEDKGKDEYKYEYEEAEANEWELTSAKGNN